MSLWGEDGYNLTAVKTIICTFKSMLKSNWEVLLFPFWLFLAFASDKVGQHSWGYLPRLVWWKVLKKTLNIFYVKVPDPFKDRSLQCMCRLKIYLYLVALALSCSMWDLVPWPRTEPRPPALGVLATGPPGKPLADVLILLARRELKRVQCSSVLKLQA